MCLVNTNRTIVCLRRLADRIEYLHGRTDDETAASMVNDEDQELILEVVNNLLGVVTVEDYKDAQGHVYPRSTRVDWDAWVHSTLLDGLGTEEVTK